jgi:hypothetical protein
VTTGDELHVVPLGDLIEHEASDECPCGPRPQSVTRDDGSIGWLQVHHSLDGREVQETNSPRATPEET